MGDSTVHRMLCVAVALLAVPTAASCEIFRCTATSGLPLYQNFPCDADAPASVPAAAPPRQVAAAIKSSQRAGATLADSQASGPRAGMKAEEVKALWGEPAQIVQDEPRSGRVEIWQYEDGRVVEINQKQRVISVTRH